MTAEMNNPYPRSVIDAYETWSFLNDIYRAREEELSRYKSTHKSSLLYAVGLLGINYKPHLQRLTEQMYVAQEKSKKELHMALERSGVKQKLEGLRYVNTLPNYGNDVPDDDHVVSILSTVAINGQDVFPETIRHDGNIFLVPDTAFSGKALVQFGTETEPRDVIISVPLEVSILVQHTFGSQSVAPPKTKVSLRELIQRSPGI